MDVLTAFFILTWYEASTPWWVAFWVILSLKVGMTLVDVYHDEIAKFLGEE